MAVKSGSNKRMRGCRDVDGEGGAGGGIPPNALLDESGNPILDETGAFILAE